ncbi:hypothetical protein [Elizabethkingia ursingii]|uniref:hypothetical protein n=1 Tax=Elizabethkingia ursingii TaxID=1756150 RepID=UPI002011AE03|nr:hypothetical protein [Elizabethkingia ursingii]MCL1670517.1 hypothetical protein [Elizabethkingia ursingii]
MAKRKSPFRNSQEFEKEIIEFANKNRLEIVEHSKKISDYFEISTFNNLVKYYKIKGYTVNPANLINGKYRYKCSPAGIQSNFSYFLIKKRIRNVDYEFEIHHNLAVQSSHCEDIFTTPDIVVINKSSIKYSEEYYSTKRTFSYVENNNMKTFCEVKNFNPFPELLFNFIGVLNELRKEYLEGNLQNDSPVQIAPCLIISGKGSKPTNLIKERLETRYNVNIIYDVFYEGHYFFTRKAGQLKKS